MFTGDEAPAYAESRLSVVSADGTSLPGRLDTGDGGAYGGSYSPDGDQIAFVRKAREGETAMVANADGSGARLVVDGISRFAPRWSPDGHSIAVVDPILGLTATVRVIPVDGVGKTTTIPITLPGPADDKIAPTTFGIDQISWQRLAP